MTRLAIALFGLLTAATAAAAENLIEAGEWRVTSTAVINGAAQPPQAKSRCITPEQAENIAATFGPVSGGTVNSDCATPTVEAAGKTLKWRLQCRGQLDIDATGEFTFDSPRHYTAAITSKGKMAGALISDVKTSIEAERAGDCTQ
jgi:hypothetical protein